MTDTKPRLTRKLTLSILAAIVVLTAIVSLVGTVWFERVRTRRFTHSSTVSARRLDHAGTIFTQRLLPKRSERVLYLTPSAGMGTLPKY